MKRYSSRVVMRLQVFTCMVHRRKTFSRGHCQESHHRESPTRPREQDLNLCSFNIAFKKTHEVYNIRCITHLELLTLKNQKKTFTIT